MSLERTSATPCRIAPLGSCTDPIVRKPGFVKKPRNKSSEINQIGWGGRIRTFTILINSEVSYRLDHAPTSDHINIGNKDLADGRTQAKLSHDCVGASFGACWRF